MTGLLTSLWQAVVCICLLAVGAIVAFAFVYFIVYAVKTIIEEVRRK